jgi:hypothetical protein
MYGKTSNSFIDQNKTLNEEVATAVIENENCIIIVTHPVDIMCFNNTHFNFSSY